MFSVFYECKYSEEWVQAVPAPVKIQPEGVRSLVSVRQSSGVSKTLMLIKVQHPG